MNEGNGETAKTLMREGAATKEFRTDAERSTRSLDRVHDPTKKSAGAILGLAKYPIGILSIVANRPWPGMRRLESCPYTQREGANMSSVTSPNNSDRRLSMCRSSLTAKKTSDDR